MTPNDIPMPPLSLRRLVGESAEHHYQNPSANPIWRLPTQVESHVEHYYHAVYDFGCGCGRQARQLLLQNRAPTRYVGVDINKEAIKWCQDNLSLYAPAFVFYHLDLYHKTYSPNGQNLRVIELPGEAQSFTIFNAHSVFTHLYWDQAIHYLKEARRLITPDGILRTTWLFFDKRIFPQMNANQHNIFLQLNDPTQAVYCDFFDTKEMWQELELQILDIAWPGTYGRPSVVWLGRKAYFGDDNRYFDVPRTVPGADLDEDLLANQSRGWLETKGDRLREALNTLGVPTIKIDSSRAIITIQNRELRGNEQRLRELCREYGFYVEFE